MLEVWKERGRERETEREREREKGRERKREGVSLIRRRFYCKHVNSKENWLLLMKVIGFC